MHPCLRAWQYCTLTSAFRLGHDDITNDRVLKKYNSIWVNIIYSIQDGLISIVNGTGFLKLYTGMHVLYHCEKLIINSNSFELCLGHGKSHIQCQNAVTMSTTRSDQSENILWDTRLNLRILIFAASVLALTTAVNNARDTLPLFISLLFGEELLVIQIAFA